jgi:hypothetical protein
MNGQRGGGRGACAQVRVTHERKEVREDEEKVKQNAKYLGI